MAAPPPRRLPEAPTTEAKIARLLLWFIPTGALLSVFVVRLVVTSTAVTERIALELTDRLAARTQSSVQLSGLSFDWSFAPCVHDLELSRVDGPFRVKVATKRACIERWASAVGSAFHAVRIKLDQPSIEFQGKGKGKRPVRKRKSGPKNRRQKERTLREIQIVFDDLNLKWETLPIPARFANGAVGPIDGTVTVQARDGKSAATISIREPTTGSQVNGRATPTAAGWDLSAGVEGDLVPILEPLLNAIDLDLRKLPSRGRIGATYASKSKRLQVDLDMEQFDVDLSNNIVASARLVGFKAKERIRLSADLKNKSLKLDRGLLEVNGVPVEFSLTLDNRNNTPSFDVGVDLRTTPMARLLRSVPGAEDLQITKDISSGALFALSFSMAGALEKPETWSPKLEHRIQGLDRPEVNSGLERLRVPFPYYPLTKEGRTKEPLTMGPNTDSWQSYKTIPYVLRRCVMVSEDSTFPFHNGVEVEEMRAAIQQAMESGERARGGSTITQQLVKNLFLTRDRTALRKAQELLLTFHLESALTKEEIFELYMNIIEWGPKIYGIKAAARHYFGRPPGRLTPKEMAYLATIIPNPPLFHAHYEQGYVPGSHVRKMHALLERLNRLGQLSSEALAQAKEQRIRFSKPKRRKGEDGSKL